MLRWIVAVLGWLLLVAPVAEGGLSLETVFSISLPCTEYQLGSASLFDDGLYVICGGGNELAAVNLTTRTNMWLAVNLDSYGVIETVAATPQVVLLSFAGAIVALSKPTGQQLWVQNGYQLLSAAAFSYGATIYALVVLPATQLYALQAFDLDTGVPGFFHYSNDLQIDGDTAFVAQYNLGNGGQIVDSMLRAVDIRTNTTLWTVPCSDTPAGGFIPAMSSEYVVISNFSGSDEVAVVLHRKNGTIAQSFQAFNGLANMAFAYVQGNHLLALIGGEYGRYVWADLRTGYITWTRSYANVGGANFIGGALVTMRYTLELTITPVGTDASPISIPHVPLLPTATLVDFGRGLIQVKNLLGFTMWDINSGTFLGRSEQTPNVVPTAPQLSAPLKWRGLNVLVSYDVVNVVEVVQA